MSLLVPILGILNPLTEEAPSGFESIASLWEWWEPSRSESLTLTSTDRIDVLAGKKGTGDDFTNITGNRPYLEIAQINGLDTALFPDGNATTSTFTRGLTSLHLFFVIKNYDGILGYRNMLWSVGDYDMWGGTNNSQGGAVITSTGSTTAHNCGVPSVDLMDFHVGEIISTPDEYTVAIDGVIAFQTFANTVSLPSAFTLGGAGWVGWYAGLYLFGSKLSNTDRASLFDYIEDRFALGITAPALPALPFWGQLVGVSRSGGAGNVITKTAGDSTDWTTGRAYSSRSFVRADAKKVRWTPSTMPFANQIVAIDNRAFSGIEGYRLQHCLFITAGLLGVFENNGTLVYNGGAGSASIGDQLEIRVSTAGAVTYHKNGTLFYASLTTISAAVPYHVWGAILENGIAIDNVELIDL